MNKLAMAIAMITTYLIVAVIMAAIIVWHESPKGNEMSTLSILTALVKGGMTPVGACAMGGNMMAESGMKSINLQDSYQRKLGYTDESYTSSVNSGSYTRAQFVADQAGYGLCQWTWHTRKANLYDFAKANGKSIGDEWMQVQFCLLEMQNEHSELWKFLQTTNDLYSATERICKEFEQPAVNNVNERFGYAQQRYKDYWPILEEIAVKGSSTMHPDPVGEPGEEGIPSDVEPPSYIMPTVKAGDKSPEAYFMLANLSKLGYDVLWLGLDACLRDFQQKKGLEVDGICGEKTWRELLK